MAQVKPGSRTFSKNNIHSELGDQIRERVEQMENTGESFSETSEILQVLFPIGVSPEAMNDLVMITRIVDGLVAISASNGFQSGRSGLWKQLIARTFATMAEHELLQDDEEEEDKDVPSEPPVFYGDYYEDDYFDDDAEDNKHPVAVDYEDDDIITYRDGSFRVKKSV